MRQIKEVEAKLEREIKQLEVRISEVDANLRVELEKVRGEIKNVETRLTQAIHRQTLWVIGSVGALMGGIRVLDWLLGHLAA